MLLTDTCSFDFWVFISFFLISVAYEPALTPFSLPLWSSFAPESLQKWLIGKRAWLESYQYSYLRDSLLGFILETFLRAVFIECPHLMEGGNNLNVFDL